MASSRSCFTPNGWYRVERICKVVQRPRTIKVSLRAEVERSSIEDNSLLKVPPQLVITNTEMNGKQSQRDGSHGMAGWQCSSASRP